MGGRAAVLIVALVVAGAGAACGGQHGVARVSQSGDGPLAAAAVAPKGDLAVAASRARVWLRSIGFGRYRVAEVMAFTRNTYVAVNDSGGHGAFELLIDRRGRWIWPEPGPNMMWNTRYGMGSTFWRAAMAHGGGMMPGWQHWNANGPMGGSGNGQMGGNGNGSMMGGSTESTASGRVSAAGARRRANEWLAAARPGTKASDPHAFPGYYTMAFERNGRPVGMLSVNASTGAVWYHAWHGRFLAEADA